MASASINDDSVKRPSPVVDLDFRKRMAEISDTVFPSSSLLETSFNALLYGQRMTLTINEYKIILGDFGVTEKHFQLYDIQGFVKVLIYYVGCWPGWKEKQSTIQLFNDKNNGAGDDDIVYEGLDETTKQIWFKEFYAYLYLKVTDMLKWDDLFNKANSLRSKLENSKDSQTQTDSPTPQGYADYQIVIEGPPKCLNSIAFTTDNDDIIIRQHVDKPWNSNILTLMQFLNCPYVNVNMEIGDISFSRSNVHLFERYISKVNVPISLTNSGHLVSVSKMDAEAECSVYTHYFFQKYFEQFLRMLDAEKSLIRGKKIEIKTIITEFLSDIEEININNKTMATNTSIYFTIGNGKYLRSKQTTQNGIHFLEILTPKVLVSLKHFRTEQDTGDKKRISFVTLNNLENNPEQFLKVINSGCISYSCNLCHKVYSSYLHIGQHFNADHREEQDVICWNCKAVVSVCSLAGTRWKHDCPN